MASSQGPAQAGLVDALSPLQIVDLVRPFYKPHPDVGSGFLNGIVNWEFELKLATAAVALSDAPASFLIMIAGDCSILLEALAGLRRQGPMSLVHIDGHSDFRHSSYYHIAEVSGAVASMNLALTNRTGRSTPNGVAPGAALLVPNEQVVQRVKRSFADCT